MELALGHCKGSREPDNLEVARPKLGFPVFGLSSDVLPTVRKQDMQGKPINTPTQSFSEHECPVNNYASATPRIERKWPAKSRDKVRIC